MAKNIPNTLLGNKRLFSPLIKQGLLGVASFCDIELALHILSYWFTLSKINTKVVLLPVTCLSYGRKALLGRAENEAIARQCELLLQECSAGISDVCHINHTDDMTLSLY